MKRMKNMGFGFLQSVLVLFAFIIVITGCKKYDASPLSTQSQSSADVSLDGFTIVNLVANTSEFGAFRIDKKLKNAWGMSADEGEIWVSAADGGVTFVYDKTGKHLMPKVTIPSHEQNVPGNPTGNVYNETEDFVIPGTGEPAEFIFASEDGTISAWNDPLGTAAKVVADRSANDASYKGIAIANDGTGNFIYATNFAKKKIDVFDKHFNRVTDKPFTDPDLPGKYAPFGIRNLEGFLFVTYARQTADGEEDSTGAGLGFVDIFNPDGSFVKRFATRGTLNAPWGIAKVDADFGGCCSGILIGNFGDGRINVYDLGGKFKGQLTNNGKPLVIDGLWAIDNQIDDIGPKQLYFTAGPNDEKDGLFGFIEKK